MQNNLVRMNADMTGRCSNNFKIQVSTSVAAWRFMAADFHFIRWPSFLTCRDTANSMKLKYISRALLIFAAGFYLGGCTATGSKNYSGTPFHDQVYSGGPQKIPGRVQCAYYDLGGEGVAYHDSDAVNNGSGKLNPADGTYLNEFRMTEGVDISYTKFHDVIDNNPYDLVQPPEGQLYVGWTVPGEWFNMTVEVERADVYTIDLLYTSNRGGTISLARNGRPLVSSINIISTSNEHEPIPWRQWHHWNVMTNVAEVELPKGISVLTLHVLTEGNMNFAYLDFKPKGK
jgi:hypothetical protein